MSTYADKPCVDEPPPHHLSVFFNNYLLCDWCRGLKAENQNIFHGIRGGGGGVLNLDLVIKNLKGNCKKI